MEQIDASPMNFLKKNITEIVSAITLVIVTIVLLLSKQEILRDPMFSGIVGIIFLIIGIFRKHVNKYTKDIELLLNENLNEIIIGISLVGVSILGFTGHFGLIRDFRFPLVPGLLLLTIGFLRIYIKARVPSIIIDRLDISGFIAGVILVIYSVFLYLGRIDIVWNPLFPLIIGIMLFAFLMMLKNISEKSEIIKSTVEESLSALSRKYRFNAITLASIDGFVIASTSNKAPEDAAKYSYLLGQHREMDIQGSLVLVDEGVHVDYVEFSGSEVMVIISTRKNINAEKMSKIKDDIVNILAKGLS